MESAILAESVLTFMFPTIILGATDKPGGPAGFAPIAIGVGLTLIHLTGIPVTSLSVNPARSTGPAVVVGGWALQQIWLFWVVPIFGASMAGLAYPWLAGRDEEPHARNDPRFATGCGGRLSTVVNLRADC
jgi:aquaporin Z